MLSGNTGGFALPECGSCDGTLDISAMTVLPPQESSHEPDTTQNNHGPRQRRVELEVDRRIRLHILPAIAPAIPHRPSREVHVIADHTRAPARLQELRKRALSCLVRAQRL